MTVSKFHYTVYTRLSLKKYKQGGAMPIPSFVFKFPGSSCALPTYLRGAWGGPKALIRPTSVLRISRSSNHAVLGRQRLALLHAPRAPSWYHGPFQPQTIDRQRWPYTSRTTQNIYLHFVWSSCTSKQRYINGTPRSEIPRTPTLTNNPGSYYRHRRDIYRATGQKINGPVTSTQEVMKRGKRTGVFR